MPEPLFGLTREQAQRVGKLIQGNERQPPAQQRQQSGASTPTPAFWAELTDEDSSNAGQYKWKKVDIDDREFADSDPAVTSGTDYSAIEASQSTGLTGKRVQLIFWGYDDAGAPRYVFAAAASASLPVGQYQYMVYQMTASNAAGWDFTRAHP